MGAGSTKTKTERPGTWVDSGPVTSPNSQFWRDLDNDGGYVGEDSGAWEYVDQLKGLDQKGINQKLRKFWQELNLKDSSWALSYVEAVKWMSENRGIVVDPDILETVCLGLITVLRDQESIEEPAEIVRGWERDYTKYLNKITAPFVRNTLKEFRRRNLTPRKSVYMEFKQERAEEVGQCFDRTIPDRKRAATTFLKWYDENFYRSSDPTKWPAMHP